MSLRTAIEMLLATPELSYDEDSLSPEAVNACEYAHAALAGTPIDPPQVVEGNIADCIATLRRYQAWRRGQPGADEIAPSLIGRALDAVIAYAVACGSIDSGHAR